jgi:hypothetical protein
LCTKPVAHLAFGCDICYVAPGAQGLLEGRGRGHKGSKGHSFAHIGNGRQRQEVLHNMWQTHVSDRQAVMHTLSTSSIHGGATLARKSF